MGHLELAGVGVYSSVCVCRSACVPCIITLNYWWRARPLIAVLAYAFHLIKADRFGLMGVPRVLAVS
jgi:hypothetical protein